MLQFYIVFSNTGIIKVSFGGDQGYSKLRYLMCGRISSMPRVLRGIFMIVIRAIKIHHMNDVNVIA